MTELSNNVARKLNCARNKDKNKETEQGQEETWTYFEVMDAVLGHKPATCPSFVDTLADRDENDNDDTLFI